MASYIFNHFHLSFQSQKPRVHHVYGGFPVNARGQQRRHGSLCLAETWQVLIDVVFYVTVISGQITIDLNHPKPE